MKLITITIILILVLVNNVESVCKRNGHILDCSSQNIKTLNLTKYADIAKYITIIDLSNNNIISINTTSFYGFVNIKKIDLSKNYIENIAKDVFEQCTKLKTLHLNGNKLTQIPILISRSLVNLNLNDNQIRQIKDYSFWKRNPLQNISLSFNFISILEPLAFYHVRRRLYTLSLYGNRLIKVPTKAIQYLKHLSVLDLRRNRVVYVGRDSFKDMLSLRQVMIFDYVNYSRNPEHRIQIDPNAFRFMRSLQELYLHSVNANISTFPNLQGSNDLRFLSISGIKQLKFPDHFCDETVYLRSIYVALSSMDKFPSLSKCKWLNTIDFVDNQIRYIPPDAFSGLRFVENIEILQNQNAIDIIHKDAFQNLPSLIELDLSHFPLHTFPNLNGTNRLRKLTLQYCQLETIPNDLCKDLPNLKVLNLAMNYITSIPYFSKCFSLETVYLYQNQIKEISGRFLNLKQLRHLDINENHISVINDKTFKKCNNLRYLNISRNLIKTIFEKTFEDTRNIKILDISHNYDLSYLPSTYLQSIVEIKAQGNKKMIDFPTQEDLPHASRLSLVYPYHCCFFMRKVQQVKHEISIKTLGKNSQWKIVDHHQFLIKKSPVNISKRQTTIEMENIEPLLKWMNNGTKLIFHIPPGHSQQKGNTMIDDMQEPYCIPTPNEFYPCDDLMGKQWLRICVWVVFLFSLLGNIAVLLVSIFNFKKLDVPRYLIINLAFADLCLSIYLGFLAFVDILTLGDFRSHALNWQFSYSCKSAGFLAVFAAELSVYTLAVITIERYTTIKYSLHVVRRMTTKHAIIVMVIGWLLSITLAALPLGSINGVNFSDYTKYSVCLPFEIEKTPSKVYVVFLLGFNLLAFIIVLLCYVSIYYFIRGSNAWNSGDSRAARRMAILVFADFFCWFPIAVTALSAIFDSSLLPSLWMSKILTVLIFPLNACVNPFLYAILTKQFRKDLSLCVKQIKEKSARNRDIRRSLLRIPMKSSMTYSTSVRRGSSCSFLFARRWSSKTGEEIKILSKGLRRQTEDETIEYQERLTSV